VEIAHTLALSGVLFFGFVIVVIALVAYALYFLIFRLGK
jgi:hypothetical protein